MAEEATQTAGTEESPEVVQSGKTEEPKEPKVDGNEEIREERTAESPKEGEQTEGDDFTEIPEIKEPNKKKREKNPFKDIVREKEEAVKIEVTPEQQKAKERMLEIRDRLMTLKWDLEHSQINPAKKELYEKLRKEYEDLEKVSKSN